MKHSFAALMLAVVMISCTREEALLVTPESSQEPEVNDCGQYVAGEARVYLSEELTAMVEEAAQNGMLETKSPGLNAALAELGISEMRRLFPHAGEYEERTRAEGLHRWYVVKYSDDVPMTKAQTCLGDLAGIDMFEPVMQIKINDFNDPEYPQMWGLYNRSYKGFDINVTKVWEEYTTGNPDVIVSVVDNGIDLSHEDLSANCLATGKHYNAVNNNNYIKAGEHGTHVAGTIAAVSNNNKGVTGIAGGDHAKGQKGVKLMSCQIFVTNDDGSTTSAGGAAAIKWGADNGAVISQNSWGYNYDRNGDGKLTGEELSNALAARITGSDQAAVDYFIKYAGCDNKGNQLSTSPMKGGVVIFAAGNDNIAMGAPAEYDAVIAVGSLAPDGTKSTFSNYGDWVDICAPGTNILSTFPGNRYEVQNGTSMACPHVSGVAALLVSYFGGPGFTNEQLKEKLLKSANTSIIPSYHKIGGLVDAYGAFAYGNDKAPSKITDLQVAGRGNNIDLTWTVTKDADGKAAYGAFAIYGTDKAKVQAATPTSLQGMQAAAFAPDARVGEKVSESITGTDFEAQYYVKVYAYSYGRSYSEATEVIAVKTTENHAPVVEIDYEGDITLFPSQVLNITLNAYDPDSHAVTLDHIKGSEAETLVKNLDGTYKLTLKGSGADMGTYEAKFKVTDEFGLSATYLVKYEIKENSAPEKLDEIDDVLLTSKGREFVIDMTDYVYDADGEQLMYTITVLNPAVVHLNPKGDKIIGTALGYGTTDVTIVAKDARNKKVEFTFKVTVKDPSDPLSLYPNPVKDYLNVATLDLADTEIVISSSTGQVMFHQVMKVSALAPAKVDMSSYVPGIYAVEVKFGGKVYKKNVVKL